MAGPAMFASPVERRPPPVHAMEIEGGENAGNGGHSSGDTSAQAGTPGFSADSGVPSLHGTGTG